MMKLKQLYLLANLILNNAFLPKGGYAKYNHPFIMRMQAVCLGESLVSILEPYISERTEIVLCP